MKFCPECGAAWQNLADGACQNCGYVLPPELRRTAPPADDGYDAIYIQPQPLTAQPEPPAAPLQHTQAYTPPAASTPPVYSSALPPQSPVMPAQASSVPPAAHQAPPKPAYAQTQEVVAPQPVQDLFAQPPGEGSLFDENFVAAQQQDDNAARAARLQARMQQQDWPQDAAEEPKLIPPSPRKARRSQPAQPPAYPAQRQAPRDEDEPPEKKGGKTLTIVAIVLVVAVLLTLVFAVLYLLGTFDKEPAGAVSGSSLPTAGTSSPAASLPAAEASLPPAATSNTATTPIQTPTEIAQLATQQDVATALDEFYRSYLASINSSALDPLVRATSACRADVTERLTRSGNKNNVFEFISAEVNTASIRPGETDGLPSILFNARLSYKHQPRDGSGTPSDGSNHQTFLLVYEDNIWKVHRFAMVDKADYEAGKYAEFE